MRVSFTSTSAPGVSAARCSAPNLILAPFPYTFCQPPHRSAGGDSLYDELSRVLFYSNGTARASDEIVFF